MGIGGATSPALVADEDDFPALFLMQPATNFHTSFTLADWKFDNRDDTARQALTAPSFFRMYHLHMNHHASHLNSDTDTGAQFLDFHQNFMRAYNSWRMDRGLESVLPYVACNPMPLGHVELNNDVVRPPYSPVGSPCAPMPLGFRIPPIGTLGDLGANPPLNSYNAVGHAVNLTWHSGPHLALGYRSLLDDGRNGDMGSTDKSPLDPAFWMWHRAVADVADVWLRTQPADLVIAVDRSGSMGLPMSSSGSTTRLAAVQEALFLLARLVPRVVPGGDGSPHRLALVSFNDTVVTNLPFTAVNSTGFFTSWSNAVMSLTASGNTGLKAGLDAARGLATSASLENRGILLFSDGTTPASSGLCSCGTNCQCGPNCSCGSHGEGDGHGTLIPVHTVAVGPAWHETGSQLGRTAIHQAGMPWSADVDALQLRQQMAYFLAQRLEAGVAFTTNAVLSAGTARSDAYTVPMLSDSAVTCALLWDQSVTPGNLTLEITSPSGTVLNLSNPAIASTTGGTFHMVRIGVPPSGGNDGNWTVRAVRRAGSGPGVEQRLHFIVLGNGFGRVEPTPSTPNAFTGQPVRVSFRVRESYWPTNGFESISASATITGPTESWGEKASTLTIPTDSTVSGDPLGGVAMALNTPAVAASLAGRTTATVTLKDDGTAGDLFPDDHTFSATFTPTREGDHQFHARFRFRFGGTNFVREARYALRVQPGIVGTSSVAVAARSTNDLGERVSTLDVVPRDAGGLRLGPGRVSDFGLLPVDEGYTVGTVSDLGAGNYRVVVSSLQDAAPALLLKQPGRDAVLLGGGDIPAFTRTPEVYAYRPDAGVVVWKSAVAATGTAEIAEPGGAWKVAGTTTGTTDHRLKLSGLVGGRKYQLRVTQRSAGGRDVRSPLVEFTTPPPSVSRIVVDRLGYNDPVSNVITGRVYLGEPLAKEVTVALSTAQTFNTDNPFTNAVATLTIPAGATELPWSIAAGPVDREVELHVSVLLGDFSPHVILKLVPPDNQVLWAPASEGPYTTNTVARIDPYRRRLTLPVSGPGSGFYRFQATNQVQLRIETEQPVPGELRVAY